MNVFDEITWQGRQFQTDSAAEEKRSLTKRVGYGYTEGRQRMEVSEEERSWHVGLYTLMRSVERNGRDEAVVEQRSEFVLYS